MKSFAKALIGGSLLAAAIVPMSASAATYPDGDANCDGTVTQADVTLLSDVILGKPGAALGGCGAKVDLNCDSKLNIFDVTRLQKLVNGQPITACTT